MLKKFMDFMKEYGIFILAASIVIIDAVLVVYMLHDVLLAALDVLVVALIIIVLLVLGNWDTIRDSVAEVVSRQKQTKQNIFEVLRNALFSSYFDIFRQAVGIKTPRDISQIDLECFASPNPYLFRYNFKVGAQSQMSFATIWRVLDLVLQNFPFSSYGLNGHFQVVIVDRSPKIPGFLYADIIYIPPSCQNTTSSSANTRLGCNDDFNFGDDDDELEEEFYDDEFGGMSCEEDIEDEDYE